MARAHPHLRISVKANDQLHGAVDTRNWNRVKRCKSWLDRAYHTFRLVFEPRIDPGKVWISVLTTLDEDFPSSYNSTDAVGN